MAFKLCQAPGNNIFQVTCEKCSQVIASAKYCIITDDGRAVVDSHPKTCPNCGYVQYIPVMNNDRYIIETDVWRKNIMRGAS